MEIKFIGELAILMLGSISLFQFKKNSDKEYQLKMKASTREYHLYTAKISEEIERFEDMKDTMNKVATFNRELTAEERKLLSVGYKKIIKPKRAAWNTLSQIEIKEEQIKPNRIDLLRSYKAKIQGELNKYCNEAINLIDSFLLEKASDFEAKVFYHKLKGDFYRYMAECSSRAQREEVVENAHSAYEIAIDIAKNLQATHPTRLGLALNYAVLYTTMKKKKNDPSKACQLYQQTINYVDIDQIQENQLQDSRIIMQAIKANLASEKFFLNQESDK